MGRPPFGPSNQKTIAGCGVWSFDLGHAHRLAANCDFNSVHVIGGDRKCFVPVVISEIVSVVPSESGT